MEIDKKDEKKSKMENSESSRERFKRLAMARTNTVLKKLDVLGNCANRYVYEYTQEDIQKIFDTINKKIKETKLLFDSGLVSKKREVEFKL